MSVGDQIQLLAALQKLDSQIYRLKKDLNNVPVQIRGIEGSFRQKEMLLMKNEEEFKAVTMKRREKEMELQAKEEGIKKLQTQLYQLKTNKEYQTMEKEIAGQKADVSIIEEDIIKLFDEIDMITKESVRQKEILERERKASEEEKKAIEAGAKETEASLQALNGERSTLVRDIDKEFLSKYERILYSKNGLAMVSVRHEACGGCNINLPPQVINEVRLRDELILCGSCARILYIEETQ